MRRIVAASIVLVWVGAAAAQTRGVIEQQALPPLPGAAPPVSAAPAPEAGPVPLAPGAATPEVPAPQQPMLHLNRDPIAAGPAPGPAVPSPSNAAPSATAAVEAPSARVFCDQSVAFRVVPRETVPEKYRPFVGIFSDAAWTPQLCAALIVQDVKPDGTASIVYAFGPMSANARVAGGVLNGTGVIRDGELRFQNADGSQFTFKPLYFDLDGHLTTPKGDTYRAVFKRTF